MVIYNKENKETQYSVTVLYMYEMVKVFIPVHSTGKRRRTRANE